MSKLVIISILWRYNRKTIPKHLIKNSNSTLFLLIIIPLSWFKCHKLVDEEFVINNINDLITKSEIN